MTIDELLQNRLAVIAKLNAEHITPIQSQLRAFESDFNTAQSSLRTIASAWILAAVGAVALVTQNEFAGTARLDPVVASSFRQALLLVAALGLTSLWFLDQRVYQRLLHSVYAIGCHLEMSTDRVLPIRAHAYLLNFDVTNHMGWFYRAPFIVLFLGSLGGLYQSAFGFNSTVVSLLEGHLPASKPAQVWVLPLAITLLHLIFFIVVWCGSKKWPTLAQLLPKTLVEEHKQAPPRTQHL